jgi:chromosome segregation ATPase
MRQDNRHKAPVKAGDLDSQAPDRRTALEVAEADAAKATAVSEGQGDGLQSPGPAIPFRFRGKSPVLESGSAGRQGLVSPPDAAREVPPAAEFDLPPLVAATEADLASELALDLERLREASEHIAMTSEWVEQQSSETSTQEGRERVESSRGRPAPAPAASPAMVGSRVATRDENTVEKKDAVPEAEHQEWVPMKTTTGKRAVADVPPGKRQGDPLGSTGAGSAGQRPDRDVHSAHMNDANRNDDMPQAATVKLEAELKEAQEALERLRERAALQTRMYGSVGAQTRKLDQRAAELRARVAKAQEALHERARKLQAALEKERDRLRAYHAKLQQKAKELAEWTQERKTKLADEIATQRRAIEAERAALARRETEVARRFETIGETDRQDVEAVRAELEQSYRSRLAEIEGQAETRQAELEARETALLRREMEQSARLKAFEESCGAAEGNLRGQAEQLAKQTQEEKAKLLQETAARRKELEESAGRREAELNRVQELLSAREQAVARGEQQIGKLKQALDEQDRGLAERGADLDRRDTELARMSAAMEVRERRLQEWQARVEQTEGRLDVVREELEKEVLTAQQSSDENQKQAATIKVQFEELQQRRADILRKREQAESQLQELREKKEQLDKRSAEVDRLKQQYQEQAESIAAERRQFADLTERSEELERQRGELAARISEVFRQEEALKAREAAHQAEVEALDRSRKDLDAVRESFTAREREIEKREAEAGEQTKRIEEFERRLQQKAQELTEERTSLDGLRAEHAEGVASLEKARDKIARQQLLLDEAQLSLQIDRQHLNEHDQVLTERQSVLQRERDRLSADQIALTSACGEQERLVAELARRQQEIAAAKAVVEADHARLERDGVSLRDRERVLTEEKTALETARGEVEDLRLDLTRRLEESEEFRQQLAEKAAQLKSRREQLARDAAAVDERKRTLDTGLADVADKDRELQREREQLQAERGRTAADRRQLEGEREELEQARRNFQAGLRSLDESRHQIAEREAELGTRAQETDQLRRRLDDERAELQRQRQELLALQEERGDATRKVEALMAQAEAQQAELRRREESLDAHQQALGARAAELSRSEDELKRRRREHETLDRDLTSESEALEAERKEFESIVESERAALEAARLQLQSEAAAERERLAVRARELEATIAAHQAASAQDDWVVERTDTEQARTDLEIELSQQLAEVARKEGEAETRCRLRLEELDRDIEQRLASLEKEIRERRELAERETGERRRMQEDEIRNARSRLDEQVEDLRRRQAAAAQEHSLLQEQRREIEEQKRELAGLRRQLESEGRLLIEGPPLGADAEPAEWMGPSVISASREALADQPDAESFTAVEPLDVPEQQVQESAEFDAADAGFLDDQEVLRHDPRQRPAEPLESPEPLGATDDGLAAERSEDDARIDAKTARKRRRPRAVAGGVLAAFIGCAVGGVYLGSTPADVVVQGRVALNGPHAAAHLTAAEHYARMQDAAVFDKAARTTGFDIQANHRNGKIKLAVAPAGDAVELTARVPRDEQSKAQVCLDGWAAAYQETLNQSVISGPERKTRLAQMEADYQKLLEDRRTAEATLEQMKTALQADSRFAQVETARAAKSDVKSKLARSRDELDAAKAALARLEGTPPATDSIVLTEEQLVQACAADGEIMQAIEQRDAKAREFHKVLTEAMSQSQTPLAALLASINELASEVDQQLADQTDKDIRRELEQIAVDLKDYRRSAEAFSRSWDELAPKVAAWKAGGDAEALLEYQKKAEMLIREFHSQSGDSSKTAGAKADAIGQGGSEMTMRRVIHARLRKALLACQQARNDWILAARGAVPRYNLELKALEDTIRDLTPRIEQRRTYHKDKLAERLLKARADERAAQLQRLREKVEEGTRQYQRLSDEFVKMDADAADESLRAELQQRQLQIREQEELVSRQERQAYDTQREIDRLRGAADVSLAGAVVYKPAPALPPDRLEWPRLKTGLWMGGLSALLSIGVFFAISGFRRPRSRPAVQLPAPQ